MKRQYLIVIFCFGLLIFNKVEAQPIRSVDSLKALLKSTLPEKERVDIYNSLAQLYRNNDSTQTAYFADQAIELARKIQYGEGISDAYYRIGWATMTKGSYNTSIELFNKALQEAQNTNYQKGELKAFNGLGVSYFYLGDFPSALDQHFKSLQISTALADRKWMANSYNNIGLIYHYQGNYTSSISYHLKSLKIMELLGNKKGMSDSYSNIGKIYEQQGDLSKALEQYYLSLELREELSDKIWAANSYRSIGKIFEIKGDYASALEYHKKSLDIMEKLGDKYGVANAYNFIGEVYLKQKAYNKAIDYQERALNLYNEIGAKAYATLPLLDLGKIYLAVSNYNLSIDYLKKAIYNAKELGRKDVVRDGAEQLASAYEKSGRYQDAFRQMKMFKQMSDSLRNEEVTEKITSQAMQYEFDKKELAAKVEQERKEAVQLQALQTQKYYTYAAIGGAMALLVIAIIVYIGRYRQKQANRLLSQQKQEIASQAEELRAYDQMVSHDLKGPLGTISQWTQLLNATLEENTVDENKEIIDNIENLSKKSISLVQGILEYASADKPADFERNVDLDKIIEDVRSAYSSTITEKQANITLSNLPKIEKAVPIKVFQLFYNLIGNALKFQKPGQKPEIKIYGDSDSIVVEDNGIGFDQNDAEDIFKPLNRLSSEYEGHGIGLGTCKRITELHGWNLSAESQLGKGTRFIISYS